MPNIGIGISRVLKILYQLGSALLLWTTNATSTTPKPSIAPVRSDVLKCTDTEIPHGVFLLLLDVYFVTLFALCFFSDFPLVWQVHISPSKCFMPFVLSLPWPDNKRHPCRIITYLLRYHSEIRKKKPFCYLIFTAALFFFSIQNNPRLLSAFSRKSAYIDVYFYKMQHGSDKRNNGEHIHLFCVAAIDLFHIWGVKTFQLFQRESDQPIIHCLRLFSFGFFSCLFDLRSNEHSAILQLNLTDFQEKLFCRVFWPFCVALARNLLVLSQQADRNLFFFSAKVADLWFMLRASCIRSILDMRLTGE